MTNPSLVVPDALQPLLDLSKVINNAGVPQQTLDFVRLRVSQINGRAIRIPVNAREPGKDGETEDRLAMVADWRDASCFDDAERAALALAEAVTCLSDREDPVPDEVWDEAARHYADVELAALVMQIGLVNLWNRVNVANKEEPAEWS
nr:carboxymuconolactone decarboxylase family protein [Phytoactinopolyspora halophila]